MQENSCQRASTTGFVAEGKRREPGKIVLETPRLRFRRFTLDDAPLLVDLDSDPEVMRYLSRKPATGLAYVQDEVLPRIMEYYNSKEIRGFWAVHTKADGAFAGWFHLRRDAFGLPDSEIGYRLKRAFWGRGLATEGARALIRMAFKDPDETRVVARTLLQNAASRRVMEKCAMVPLMRFRYPENLLSGFSAEEREAIAYFITRETAVAGKNVDPLLSQTDPP